MQINSEHKKQLYFTAIYEQALEKCPVCRIHSSTLRHRVWKADNKTYENILNVFSQVIEQLRAFNTF